MDLVTSGLVSLCIASPILFGMVVNFVRDRRSGKGKNLDLCHKYESNWAADGTCTYHYGNGDGNCHKRASHWVHYPMRYQPHKFKPHIRRDIGTTMNWCDVCSKRGGWRFHKMLLPVASQIEQLEKWHENFRYAHPEFEDQVRNELFPELAPPKKNPSPNSGVVNW